MFDHVDFAVVNLAVSRKFYEIVLATLGIEPFMDVKTDEGREGTGYGSLTGEQFWIGKGKPVKGRMHIAFSATSRSSVDAFFEAALGAGGKAKGTPGVRPTYGEHYYAAFVLDPDGHTIEAVCRHAEIGMDLNQVTIPCENYGESVKFYKRLGLHQIVDSPPRYARFETKSGTTLSIHRAESTRLKSDVVIYFEVEDVDAMVEILKKNGLAFESGPTDQSWLWREARLRDPAGNTVCIYHAGENRRYPPWRIDTEGV